MNIRTAKIGKFTLLDLDDVFKHSSGNSGQYSDASHRVRAFIKPASVYSGETFSPSNMKFEGICGNIETKKSYDNIFTKKIRNTISGKYWTQRGARVKEDTTIIEASASAGYPFVKLSPNIDFKITAKLYRNGNSINITINGEHDNFPAYELIVSNRVLYNYDPSRKGYTGPNLYNLNTTTYFNASQNILNI